eukprot:360262-Chlamydomonas_euryale.AAC.8
MLPTALATTLASIVHAWRQRQAGRLMGKGPHYLGTSAAAAAAPRPLPCDVMRSRLRRNICLDGPRAAELPQAKLPSAASAAAVASERERERERERATLPGRQDQARHAKGSFGTKALG